MCGLARRPAGRAVRRGLPRARRGQVHVRDRRVPARARSARSRAGRRTGSWAASPGSCATATAEGGAGTTPRTTYCLDGQVYTVGAAVHWLTELGLVSDATDLDRLGADVPDAGGAVFVPGLAGLGAPFWRPHARGAFTGLSLATSRAALVRAVVDGIAAQVAWLARAAGDDLGAPLTRLRVDGGLTRSRLLMQTQADLLQAPVEVYASPHATALGVAAFARLGHGRGGDAGRGRRYLACPPRRYEPSDLRRRGRGAPHRLARRRRSDHGPRHRERRRRRRRRGGRGGRVCASRGGWRGRGCGSRCSKPGRTSGPARARPTPRSSTRASTPSRAVRSRRWSRAGTRCSPTTRQRTGIPVERTGALLVAWNEEQLAALPRLAEQAAANGYDRCEVVDAATLHAPRAPPRPGRARRADRARREPDLPVDAADRVRDRSRRQRGATCAAAARWSAPSPPPTAGRSTRRPGALHAALGRQRRRVAGRRRRAAPRPRRLHRDAPARRADRLRQAGPPARAAHPPAGADRSHQGRARQPDRVRQRRARARRPRTSTTRPTPRRPRPGSRRLLDHGRRILPALLDEEVTAVYAGLRAATEESRLPARVPPRATAPSASAASARRGSPRRWRSPSGRPTASRRRARRGGTRRRTAGVTVPNLGEAFPRPYQQADRIAADPEYGAIVCHCERVTAGELRDAFAEPRPAGRPRRRPPAHARADGPLPGLLLLGRRGEPVRRGDGPTASTRSWRVAP